MIQNYRLLRTVGEGSYSKVKLGCDVNSGQEVAMKCVDKSDTLSLDVLKREMTNMRLLDHPHIIQLIEIIETEQEVIMVMEYVPGGDLLDFVVEQGPLDEEEARELFLQLVSAVQHCHLKGIAHRDLKPENILVDIPQKLKITDFGFCKNFLRDPLRTLCGTPVYTAPEIMQGGTYGPEVDIWSLGVVLYFMVTGRLPFPIEKFGKPYSNRYFFLPDNMSPELQHLLINMIRFNPQRRISWEGILAHPWVTLSSVVVPSVEPVPSIQTLKTFSERECQSCPPALPPSSWEENKGQDPVSKIPLKSVSLPLRLEVPMTTLSPVLWPVRPKTPGIKEENKASSTKATLGSGANSSASLTSENSSSIYPISLEENSCTPSIESPENNNSTQSPGNGSYPSSSQRPGDSHLLSSQRSGQSSHSSSSQRQRDSHPLSSQRLGQSSCSSSSQRLEDSHPFSSQRPGQSSHSSSSQRQANTSHLPSSQILGDSHCLSSQRQGNTSHFPSSQTPGESHPLSSQRSGQSSHSSSSQRQANTSHLPSSQILGDSHCLSSQRQGNTNPSPSSQTPGESHPLSSHRSGQSSHSSSSQRQANTSPLPSIQTPGETHRLSSQRQENTNPSPSNQTPGDRSHLPSTGIPAHQGRIRRLVSSLLCCCCIPPQGSWRGRQVHPTNG